MPMVYPRLAWLESPGAPDPDFLPFALGLRKATFLVNSSTEKKAIGERDSKSPAVKGRP